MKYISKNPLVFQEIDNHFIRAVNPNTGEFTEFVKPDTFPYVQVEHSASDIRVSRHGFRKLDSKKRVIGGNRNRICEFSIKSQQNLLFKLRSCVQKMQNVITLTYPIELLGQLDGVIIKRHIHNFFKAYKRKFGNSVDYAWVLEFQHNGNPHFHIVTSNKVDLGVMISWVSLTWYRIVGSGLEKHYYAGTRCEYVNNKNGVASYLAKYLQKSEQKYVPDNFKNVGRFWGLSRRASEIEKLNVSCPDNLTADYFVKDISRLHRKFIKSLRYTNKKNYRIRAGSGGFTFYNGSILLNQLNLPVQSSFREFEDFCKKFSPQTGQISTILH